MTGRVTSVASAAMVAAFVAAGPARADEPDHRHVVEADLTLAYARMVRPRPDATREIRAQNGGLAVSLGATYRTRFFLSPWIELGYAPLYASDTRAPAVDGGAERTASSSLVTWTAAAGIAYDVWRLRARAGVALFDLEVRSTLDGARLSTRELDMGYVLALGGTVVRADRLRVGLELRAGIDIDAATSFLALGIAGSFDALRWP